jgi:predicted deacylase
VNRRTFLASAAATAAGLGAGLSVAGGQGEALPTREPTERLLAGTDHETPVYELAGDEPGPTALVVGGMHGDERSGYLAAERVLDWTIDAGRLVVLPRANQVAIEHDTRHGEGGDLNRKFPPGQAPTTELARAIWDLTERTNPDVALNLHSSKGIYGTHAEFVGQAIFPTEAGDAPRVAAAVVEALNGSVVPWYMPLHDFARGNVLSGTAPLFAHKVGGDLERPAYIVEVTEYLLDAETGARWTERAAAELLARHGIERGDGGGAR